MKPLSRKLLTKGEGGTKYRYLITCFARSDFSLLFPWKYKCKFRAFYIWFYGRVKGQQPQWMPTVHIDKVWAFKC